MVIKIKTQTPTSINIKNHLNIQYNCYKHIKNSFYKKNFNKKN